MYSPKKKLIIIYNKYNKKLGKIRNNLLYLKYLQFHIIKYILIYIIYTICYVNSIMTYLNDIININIIRASVI